jgi:hypothetical protein
MTAALVLLLKGGAALVIDRFLIYVIGNDNSLLTSTLWGAFSHKHTSNFGTVVPRIDSTCNTDQSTLARSCKTRKV